MTIDNYKGIIRLFADEGKRITNSERAFFSDFIYLGKNDSPNNYEEVGREIWKHFITEENPDIKEMQNQIKDLKEEATRLKNENIFLTELLLENDYRISQEINSLKQSK